METPGTSITDYTLVKEIGRGSFGVVYKAVSLRDGKTYCVKKINVTHMSPKRQREALQEANLLKNLNHPNIIKYVANYMEGDCLCIVMEHAEGGDLQRLVKSHRDSRRHFPEAEVWRFARELSQALCSLHSRKIIHRDVKCPNVLLGNHNRVKLGDLGASKIIEAAEMQSTRVGTPLYLAPELVRQFPYDFKVDIWGMGCVMYQICCLEAPFAGDNLLSLGQNIVHSKPKALPSVYSTKLSQFVFKLLEKRPAERPSISQVMAMIPGGQRIRIDSAPSPYGLIPDLSNMFLTNSETSDASDVKAFPTSQLTREIRPHTENQGNLVKSTASCLTSDSRPDTSRKSGPEGLKFLRGYEGPIVKKLPSRELLDRTLPEIKDEARPFTTTGRNRSMRMGKSASSVKIKVSDLNSNPIVPVFSEASIVKPRPVSPFRSHPVRERLSLPTDQISALETSKVFEDTLQRPTTVPKRSRTIIKEPNYPLMKRPISVYIQQRSATILKIPRIIRQMSATSVTLPQPEQQPKKKLSVADLHGVY